jgi:hypothetical protein
LTFLTQNDKQEKKITANEIETVQRLIEKCLKLYMNQTEVATALNLEENIDQAFANLGAASFTSDLDMTARLTIFIVWQKLEETNPEFFKAYNIRLRIKEQITAFNYLVSQQAQLMQKSGQFRVPAAKSSLSNISVAAAPIIPISITETVIPAPSKSSHISICSNCDFFLDIYVELFVFLLKLNSFQFFVIFFN